MGAELDLNGEWSPQIERFDVMDGLNEGLSIRLGPLRRTLERAQGAVFFCDHVAFTPAERRLGRLFTSPEQASAYLRAALAEYAAMAEVLKLDLKDGGIPGPALGHLSTRNPLLFMLYELRNVNLHAEATTLIPATVPIRVHDEFAPSAEGHKFTIWAAVDLPRDHLQRRLVGQERLSTAELIRLVDWFDQQQRRFGIAEVINSAVHLYGLQIVRHHLGGVPDNTLRPTRRAVT